MKSTKIIEKSLSLDIISRAKLPVFIENDANKIFYIVPRIDGKGFLLTDLAFPQIVINIKTFFSVDPNEEILNLINENDANKEITGDVLTYSGIAKDSLFAFIRENENRPTIVGGLIKKCYAQMAHEGRILYCHIFDDFAGPKVPVKNLGNSIKIITPTSSFDFEKKNGEIYFKENGKSEKIVAIYSLLNFEASDDTELMVKQPKAPIVTSDECLYINKPFMIIFDNSSKYISAPIAKIESDGGECPLEDLKDGLSYEIKHIK